MHYQPPPHPSKATFFGNAHPYIPLQLLSRFILLWFTAMSASQFI